MIRLAFALPLFVFGCEEPNETVASYGASGITWQLSEIEGAAFPAQATLILEEDGSVHGQAPCNSYRAQQTVPYPWFKIEAIAATKLACPDLPSETAFFDALQKMTLSEVSGLSLIHI